MLSLCCPHIVVTDGRELSESVAGYYWNRWPDVIVVRNLTRQIKVVEEIGGNEVAFGEDRLPALLDEIGRCAEPLGYTRRALLTAVGLLPADVMHWDPRCREFAPYAW